MNKFEKLNLNVPDCEFFSIEGIDPEEARKIVGFKNDEKFFVAIFHQGLDHNEAVCQFVSQLNLDEPTRDRITDMAFGLGGPKAKEKIGGACIRLGLKSGFEVNNMSTTIGCGIPEKWLPSVKQGLEQFLILNK